MFSGIGGFESGIQRACNMQSTKIEQDRQGGNGNPDEVEHNVLPTSRATPLCVGFSEVDKYAIQIYKKHFKEHKNYGDARRIVWEDVPDFDMLCGGFPCQAFSIAGKRGGFEDTRGTLFYEIAKGVRIKRPKLLFLENVKGLLSHDNGRTFGTILSTFSDLGYILEWQVLNSKNFGVPQNRERVFIIGHLGGERRPEVFPFSVPGGKYTQEVQRVLCPTLKARDYKDGGKWLGRIRRLTPVEAERLQGFPDDWTKKGMEEYTWYSIRSHKHRGNREVDISDTQRYKCLGNAVTVNVIEAIARKIWERN